MFDLDDVIDELAKGISNYNNHDPSRALQDFESALKEYPTAAKRYITTDNFKNLAAAVGNAEGDPSQTANVAMWLRQMTSGVIAYDRFPDAKDPVVAYAEAVLPLLREIKAIQDSEKGQQD